MKAFLRVARLHSFTAAAREMEVVASVVTKRVTQLEEKVGAKLVMRSTRGLSLTAAGERYLARFALLVAEYDEIFLPTAGEGRRIEGQLKILSPPTITSMFLGALLSNFQIQYPDIDMSVALSDRPVNPLEEGYDLALGAVPASYPGVVDVTLCPYDLVACCAPGYLIGRELPQHPTDFTRHQCLTTGLFRTNWSFKSKERLISVEVHSRMQSSDMRMVRDAARKGLGVTILPCFLVNEDLKSGRLIQVLPEFPVAPYSLKVLVPRMKMKKPAVHSLVTYIKANMQPPPWETSSSLYVDDG